MPTIIRLTNASEAGASFYANLDLVKSLNVLPARQGYSWHDLELR